MAITRRPSAASEAAKRPVPQPRSSTGSACGVVVEQPAHQAVAPGEPEVLLLERGQPLGVRGRAHPDPDPDRRPHPLHALGEGGRRAPAEQLLATGQVGLPVRDVVGAGGSRSGRHPDAGGPDAASNAATISGTLEATPLPTLTRDAVRRRVDHAHDGLGHVVDVDHVAAGLGVDKRDDCSGADRVEQGRHQPARRARGARRRGRPRARCTAPRSRPPTATGRRRRLAWPRRGRSIGPTGRSRARARSDGW